MGEAIGLAKEDRFDELTKNGVSMTGGPFGELREGWGKSCFPCEGKAHYFKRNGFDGIAKGIRYYGWTALCGHDEFTSDQAQMLHPGNWSRCKRCEKPAKRLGKS